MTLAAAVRPETERDFQDAVIELARWMGWRVAHFRPAMTTKGWRTPVSADGKGFPDLLLVRGNRIIVAELKRDGAKPTPEQTAWLMDFARAGITTYVWHPRDFPDIELILR